MGVSPEMPANSPLNSFLLPGLFLVLVNGLSNVAGAYLSFTRHRYVVHVRLTLGFLLTIWIIIKVTWISLISFLQPLFLVAGLINIFLRWKILKSTAK
ncbi:MAG: hypothetical protein WAV93_11950 [Bacteroidales bacterium]